MIPLSITYNVVFLHIKNEKTLRGLELNNIVKNKSKLRINELAGLSFICQILFLLMAVACNRSHNMGVSDTKYIFGENDLKKVMMSQGGHIEAIGLMSKGCTVSHIGNGIVVTAGHCIKINFIESSTSPCGQNTEVTWGYTDDNKENNLKSRCVELIEYEYTGNAGPIDYAILRYDPFPDKSLTVKKGFPVEGEAINIYSHPEKRTLEESGWCEITGTMLTARSKFTYFCDTERGSSGAPIFDKDMAILGVHNGRDKDRTYNHATPLFELELDYSQF